MRKHLPDPFYLEGIERISLRDAIFREVASNILIHREYTNAYPAKLIIENGQVRTENSNKPHGFGSINPANFTPYPKNPVISRFFRQIGWADELGSGMRNMMKYGRAYGGADPEMVEGDVFRIVVKTQDFTNPIDSLSVSRAKTQPETQPESQPESLEVRVLRLLRNGPLAKSEMSLALGQKNISGQLNKVIRKLIADGLIEMTIPDKPSSRLQKYRLTAEGSEMLQGSTGNTVVY